MVAPGLGWLSSAPRPSIPAGFCGRAGQRGAQRPRSGAAGALDVTARERIMPGGGGQGALVRVTVQRFRLLAFLCGPTSRGGRGQGQEQPALPRSAGFGRCPGDMMIDWASPPAEMRPLSLAAACLVTLGAIQHSPGASAVSRFLPSPGDTESDGQLSLGTAQFIPARYYSSLTSHAGRSIRHTACK
jgi:hypothetical protein